MSWWQKLNSKMLQRKIKLTQNTFKNIVSNKPPIKLKINRKTKWYHTTLVNKILLEIQNYLKWNVYISIEYNIRRPQNSLSSWNKFSTTSMSSVKYLTHYLTKEYINTNRRLKQDNNKAKIWHKKTQVTPQKLTLLLPTIWLLIPLTDELKQVNYMSVIMQLDPIES